MRSEASLRAIPHDYRKILYIAQMRCYEWNICMAPANGCPGNSADYTLCLQSRKVIVQVAPPCLILLLTDGEGEKALGLLMYRTQLLGRVLQLQL